MVLVRQRDAKAQDFGIAALATLLGPAVRYEDVSSAAAVIEPVYRGLSGLHNPELIAIAQHLGVTLVQKRRFDLDRDEGVLRVYGSHTKTRGHWVAIRYGRVWDPCPKQGCAAPWRTYVARRRVEFGTFLRAIDG